MTEIGKEEESVFNDIDIGNILSFVSLAVEIWRVGSSKMQLLPL